MNVGIGADVAFGAGRTVDDHLETAVRVYVAVLAVDMAVDGSGLGAEGSVAGHVAEGARSVRVGFVELADDGHVAALRRNRNLVQGSSPKKLKQAGYNENLPRPIPTIQYNNDKYGILCLEHRAPTRLDFNRLNRLESIGTVAEPF